MTIPDRELDEFLTAAAHVIGCDEPQARDRIIHIIKEPCGAPDCPFCDKPEKRPMPNIHRALTIAKIAVVLWAVFAVAALAFAMVFGQELP